MPIDVYENPFCILGASAQDGAQRLIELADDAALLGDKRAEKALSALMHSRSRLEAEMDWFPGAGEADIEAVLDYLKASETAAFPPVGHLSALARLNACSLLLESWPVTDEKSALAVCLSTARAACGLSAAGLMEQINADRAKAGMQRIVQQDVLDRIGQVCRQTAKRLYERMSFLPEAERRKVLEGAAKGYADLRSPILAALIGIHEVEIYDEKKRLEDEMYRNCETICTSTKYAERTKAAKAVVASLARWGDVTRPVRRLQAAKGYPAPDSKRLYTAVLNASCEINNKHKQHKECLDLTNRMIDVFFDLPGEQELLHKNREIVSRVLNQT
ncbi:MAG: hypothetical protein IJD60_03180 [Clostridia bacterium]|nr:hypothetical protein [Clostridia bacterium]